MTSDRIGLHPRTQARTIVRVFVSSQECWGWHVFFSCPSPGAPYKEMLGNGILLCDNGVAMHTNWQPDKTIETQVFP